MATYIIRIIFRIGQSPNLRQIPLRSPRITEPEYVRKYQPGASVPLYFSAVLDKVPVGFGAFNGADIRPDERKATGVGAGLYLTFRTQDQESVTAKVGLSYTSVENARLNRETEAATLTFDEAREISRQTWEEYLGRIRVETPAQEDKVKFYTGLYHALLGRGLASDVNGAYPRNDGSVGQIPLKDGKPIHNLYNTDNHPALDMPVFRKSNFSIPYSSALSLTVSYIEQDMAILPGRKCITLNSDTRGSGKLRTNRVIF